VQRTAVSRAVERKGPRSPRCSVSPVRPCTAPWNGPGARGLREGQLRAEGRAVRACARPRVPVVILSALARCCWLCALVSLEVLHAFDEGGDQEHEEGGEFQDVHDAVPLGHGIAHGHEGVVPGVDEDQAEDAAGEDVQDDQAGGPGQQTDARGAVVDVEDPAGERGGGDERRPGQAGAAAEDPRR